MGEWRVFIERKNDETDFDLWRALKVPLTAVTPVQSRSDTYLVATHDVGVKFRGDGPTTKPLLEIKVRLSRKKRGVEKWEKIMTAPVDCDPRTFGPIELRRELEHRGFLTGKHAPQLLAVLKLWTQEAPVRLSLVKQRRQYQMERAPLLVEQADFYVQLNGTPIGPRFRTINMEARKARQIRSLLESIPQIVQQLRGQAYIQGCAQHRYCKEARPEATGCITAGFPEFVSHFSTLFAINSQIAAIAKAPGSSSTVPAPPLEPLKSA